MITKAFQPALGVGNADVKRSLWSRLWFGLTRPAAARRAAPVAPRPVASIDPPPRRASATPVEPPPRSVPVPIDALTALLDREPAGRARLRHLALLALKWQPEILGPSPGPSLAPDSMIGGSWGVTDFQATLSVGTDEFGDPAMQRPQETTGLLARPALADHPG